MVLLDLTGETSEPALVYSGEGSGRGEVHALQGWHEDFSRLLLCVRRGV